MMHYRFLFLYLFIFTLNACELFIGIDDKRFDGFVNFDYVRDRINDSYAQLTWKEKRNNFNWDEIARENRLRIRRTMPAHELMKVLKNTLGVLKDGHVYFILPNGTSLRNGDTHTEERFYGEYSGFIKDSPISGPKRVFHHYLTSNTRGYSKKNQMMYGTIVENKTHNDKKIGYLYITSFASNDGGLTTIQKWARDIDDIVAKLFNTDGLILDVRQNGGGYFGNLRWIAGRFINEKKHFQTTYDKNGPKRSDFKKYPEYIKPGGPRQYTKPIVLITDGGTASAGEVFTLALRSFTHITHFGQSTLGIIAGTTLFEMPNGWQFACTTSYGLAMEENKEKSYEQDGIPPHITTKYNESKLSKQDEKIDPMLEEALDILVRELL